MSSVARPRLVLLNGPPGIGKTTLARRYVRDRPLALVLDLDTLRRALGRWEEQQELAGLLARELALAMVQVHLAAGHDVVLPQYVARTAFLVDLAAAARAAGGDFFEVYLTDTKDQALARFAARAEDEDLAAHHAEAARDVGGAQGLSAMFDRVEAVRAGRADAITVRTRAGDLDGAYRDVLVALDLASRRH